MTLTEPSILLAIVIGAIGGFALDLVQDGGLRGPSFGPRDSTWFLSLGFLSNMCIGALAAVITYSLNPPAELLPFIALTATAGVGGSAILKSYVNGQVAAQATANAEALRADVSAAMHAASSPAAAAATAGPSLAAVPAEPGLARQLQDALNADTRRRQRVMA